MRTIQSGMWRRGSTTAYHFFERREKTFSEKSACGLMTFSPADESVHRPRFKYQMCMSCEKMTRGIPGNSKERVS